MNKSIQILYPIIELNEYQHDMLPFELVYENFKFINFFFYNAENRIDKKRTYIDSNGNLFSPDKVRVKRTMLMGLLREYEVVFTFLNRQFSIEELREYAKNQVNIRYNFVNESYKSFLFEKISLAGTYKEIILGVLDAK